MKKSKELREERATVITQARAIDELAEKEDRELTSAELENYDKLMKRCDELKTTIDRLEKRETIETELETSQGRAGQLERANKGDKETRTDEPEIFELRNSICGDNRTIRLPDKETTKKLTAAFRQYLSGNLSAHSDHPEIRALQKDSDVAGGFLSAPEQFQAELIKFLDNNVFMRQIARVLPPIATAESLGAPSLDTDIADPNWTVELDTGTEDSSLAFGKRILKPNPLAKMIKVSKTLIRRSTMSADSIVRSRLGYKMSVVEENAFLNGSGANQPLGVFTASDDGIPTSRDVSTGNTTTSITFDGLKECEYSLKVGHRKKASWILHRDALKQIAKLKDGEGRYIWVQSVQVGQPDRILNMVINESEYAPNTFTTGLYVGILGNWEHYWIVDALTIQIQVLLELYARTNQNAYISRLECDAMPVLAEAFSRVKLG